MIEVQHDCDKCSSSMGRRDDCLCQDCINKLEEDAYNRGYESGKEDGKSEELRTH